MHRGCTSQCKNLECMILDFCWYLKSRYFRTNFGQSLMQIYAHIFSAYLQWAARFSCSGINILICLLLSWWTTGKCRLKAQCFSSRLHLNSTFLIFGLFKALYSTSQHSPPLTHIHALTEESLRAIWVSVSYWKTTADRFYLLPSFSSFFFFINLS